jgi:uncharacterized RDD family membrane protein YckC
MPARIQRKYKTFVQRWAAAIIDGIVFFPVFLIVTNLIEGHDTVGFISRTILLNVIWIAYSAGMHAKYGQTLGKMASNVKVYSLDEKTLLRYDKALMREIIQIAICLLGLLYVLTRYRGIYEDDPETVYNYFTFYPSLISTIVELVTIFSNPKRRALHDYFAESVVLDITKYKKWDFEYEEPVQQAPGNS